jgi:hypothetical protein
LAAAWPEPKQTRWGRVSWMKRMLPIFRYPPRFRSSRISADGRYRTA